MFLLNPRNPPATISVMKTTLLVMMALFTSTAIASDQGQACCAMCATLATTAEPAAAEPTDDAASEPEVSAVSPELDQWLDRIEARAQEIRTLRAAVRYDRVQGLLGDHQRRFGTLAYDAGPPARFAVHFDRLLVFDVQRRQDRTFIFDGRWLAEKIGEDQLFIRRELVPEQHEGELDLLALGEGPFALPLNLEKRKLLERFDVTLVAERSEAEGLEETLHLRLEPREHVRIDHDWIEIWYHRETLLPVQVHAEREEAEESSIIRLMRPELNVSVDESAFDTSAPAEPGWDVQEHRYEPPQAEPEADESQQQ